MSQSPQQVDKMNWSILFLCWFIVSVSATISIFFSSVLEYEPCVLCWYQRIFLFPQVLILAAGLFPAFDKSVIKFALPLTIAGGLTAFYHTLLYAAMATAMSSYGQQSSHRQQGPAMGRQVKQSQARALISSLP